MGQVSVDWTVSIGFVVSRFGCVLSLLAVLCLNWLGFISLGWGLSLLTVLCLVRGMLCTWINQYKT